MRNSTKAASILLITGMFFSANVLAGGGKAGGDPDNLRSTTGSSVVTTGSLWTSLVNSLNI